jgi:hypothetical protein
MPISIWQKNIPDALFQPNLSSANCLFWVTGWQNFEGEGERQKVKG